MSKYSSGDQACLKRLVHYPTDLNFYRYVDDRFPAQEIIAGASKVPSIIYYDEKGRVKAIGAEAIKDGILEAAIEGDWHKAEWYAFN